MGAADAIANLLYEFNIAPKKDDKLTNKRNGKVILVKLMVKPNLSELSVKPGAIKKTNIGMKISTITIIKRRLKIKELNILFANLPAFSFPLSNSVI